jgi:hypothetical protein
MAGTADIQKRIASIKFTVMTVSKWLEESEKSVFCNVTETGDIVEVQHEDFHHWGISIRTTPTRKHSSSNMLRIFMYITSIKKLVTMATDME